MSSGLPLALGSLGLLALAGTIPHGSLAIAAPTSPPTPEERAAMIADARAWKRRSFPGSSNPTGECLVMALAIIGAGQRAGRRFVLQAGSAYWRRMREEDDDGVSPFQFGYEWEPDSRTTRARLAMMALPEIHVWAGDPVHQDLIDLTAGDFPAQCKKLLNEDWKAEKPPEVLWGRPPDNAIYRADLGATQVAAMFANRLLGR
jgi:hypothetical protein